jgi:nicotinate-nucleotide adenylyltransferase
MGTGRRVGIMGGTFDPLHLGHLVTAEQARADLGLDEVVFVPAGSPWQKPRAVTDPEHRYLMTVLATAANPAFTVSRIELDREGPSYTVDTLRALDALLPEDDRFFITGADAILSILTWKSAGECLALATFVAATRPGHDLSDLEHEGLRDAVIQLDVPALAISSTDVRDRFAAVARTVMR